MQSINLQIFQSPLVHESRALKQAHALLAAGLADRVDFAGIAAPHLPASESPAANIYFRRFSLVTSGLPSKLPFRLLKHMEWTLRILWHYRQAYLVAVQAHSLPALFPAVLIKLFKSVPLVYDAHELETERNGMSKPLRALARRLEAVLLPFVDRTYVVSGAISIWYKQRYAMPPPPVIRNIPDQNLDAFDGQTAPLRERLQIPAHALVCLYLGAMAPGRGIALMVEAFRGLKVDSQVHLVGIGGGSEAWRFYNSGLSNVHYLPPVPIAEVLYWTRAADVGLCLIENTSLSYYYCLPNKLFEYLKAGLPVVASDFPEISTVVQQFDCGWLTKPEPLALMNLLIFIKNNQLEFDKKRIGATRAASALDWKFEVDVFLKHYPTTRSLRQ